jgi:hypothetical protein
VPVSSPTAIRTLSSRNASTGEGPVRAAEEARRFASAAKRGQ